MRRVACLVRLGASTGRKRGNDAGLAFEICVQLCHGLVVDRSVKEHCNFSAITVVHGLVRFANLVESASAWFKGVQGLMQPRQARP